MKMGGDRDGHRPYPLEGCSVVLFFDQVDGEAAVFRCAGKGLGSIRNELLYCTEILLHI